MTSSQTRIAVWTNTAPPVITSHDQTQKRCVFKKKSTQLTDTIISLKKYSTHLSVYSLLKYCSL